VKFVIDYYAKLYYMDYKRLQEMYEKESFFLQFENSLRLFKNVGTSFGGE